MDNWSEEWPTEPGNYWFYGWPFRDRHNDPELHFVKVRNTAVPGQVARIANGHFLYKQEGGFGVWQKAVIPALPYIDVKRLAKERG